MIVPDDLDLDTADREEIIAKLVASGAYTQKQAEDVADMIEAGDLLL